MFIDFRKKKRNYSINFEQLCPQICMINVINQYDLPIHECSSKYK